MNCVYLCCDRSILVLYRNSLHRCLCVGESSGKVVIWNMAPVRCEKDDKDKNVPKVLCQMDHHLG